MPRRLWRINPSNNIESFAFESNFHRGNDGAQIHFSRKQSDNQSDLNARLSIILNLDALAGRPQDRTNVSPKTHFCGPDVRACSVDEVCSTQLLARVCFPRFQTLARVRRSKFRSKMRRDCKKHQITGTGDFDAFDRFVFSKADFTFGYCPRICFRRCCLIGWRAQRDGNARSPRSVFGGISDATCSRLTPKISDAVCFTVSRRVSCNLTIFIAFKNKQYNDRRAEIAKTQIFGDFLFFNGKS